MNTTKNGDLIIFVFLFLGQPGIRSRFATLSILVPPEPPKILQGDFLVTTEDREIELECVSVGGKPAAEVIFSDRFVIDLREKIKNTRYSPSKTHETS